MKTVFFGSFQHYSRLVLEGLYHSTVAEIIAIVTTPPSIAGRKKILTKNPVHQYAEAQNIPVFTFPTLTEENLDKLKASLPNPIDLFLTAGYGNLLPKSWLGFPNQCLNLHFSLLPAYRGANPAEWALLLGETKTGITLMQMNSSLDQGALIAQTSIPITPASTRETIYDTLYRLGQQTLPTMLSTHFKSLKSPSSCQPGEVLGPNGEKINFYWPPEIQTKSPTPFAKKISRDDAFIEWPTLKKTMTGVAVSSADFSSPILKSAYLFLEKKGVVDGAAYIERSTRALAGFPSLWTIIPTKQGNKRLKIHSARTKNNKLILLEVQLEGKNTALFNQIKNSLN